MRTIRENDIVSVYFTSIQYALVKRGIVHHVPCNVGDSWHIEDLNTGDIIYISEGCTVIKKKEDNVE